jgi:hypothetical protein
MASREKRDSDFEPLTKRVAMNTRRTSIFAAATVVAIAAATLPLTAAADGSWDRGWRGHGHSKPWKHGHGYYQPWKRSYYGYARPVVPARVYAYPRYVPAPVYAAPPPPVVYPPVAGGFTFIWSGGW